ncbi:MAG: hypothetical protein ACR2RF_16700, partial [Geminicoccaceae bacterium]
FFEQKQRNKPLSIAQRSQFLADFCSFSTPSAPRHAWSGGNAVGANLEIIYAKMHPRGVLMPEA